MRTLLPILICLMGSVSPAAFLQNQRRYMSGAQLAEALGEYFSDSNLCAIAKESDLLLYGANSPLTGQPVLSQPTQATVQAILKCVTNSMDNSYVFLIPKAQYSAGGTYNYSVMSFANQQRLLGPTLLGWILQHPFTQRYKTDIEKVQYGLDSLSWQDLNAGLQMQILADWTEEILGTDEEIVEFGLIQDPQLFRQHLNQFLLQGGRQSLLTTCRILAQNLLTRDEFLSY